MIITAAQCRAARASLDWSQPDLAKKSGIHVQTISNFEHGNGSPTNKTLETTRKTFENEGIEFGEGEGVRKSLQQIKNFNGQQGFWAFFDDIYNVAKSHKNPDIFITNAKEKEFDKWLSEYEPIHNARMTKLNGPKIRVLLKEKDRIITSASYCNYRWMKESLFGDVCIYLYGDKSAFIQYSKDDVLVTLVESGNITDSLRKMFQEVWNNAEEIKI